MSLIRSIKNLRVYKKFKKAKDDYITRRMVAENKKRDYIRKLQLFENTKNYKYDIFDYNSIIEERPDNDFEYTSYNGFYGLSYIMKRYTGYKGIIHPIFFHGCNIDLYAYAEFELSKNATGIVCSKRLADNIEENTDKVILAIGPTILYAEPVLTAEETDKIKGELGKTLLILPSHSGEWFSCENSGDSFLNYVEKVKKDYAFDTVLVSVYFCDILKGEDKYFLERGYRVVSAGNRNSRDFLDVQRTLFEICDGVISQGYTSGIAYGFSLKKPIAIFDEEIVYHTDEHPDEKVICDQSAEYRKFVELFGDYTDKLSDEQLEYGDYLWNVSKKRSKTELKEILELGREIDKARSKKKKSELIDKIRKYK